MQLVADIGNTSIKWALAGPGNWVRGQSIEHGRDWPACFDRIWSDLAPPDQIAISNVAGEDAGRILGEWCISHWSQEPVFARSDSRKCNIRNAYKNPGSLGVDRWMSLIGARTVTTSAVAVVDCGTAVTVDLLDQDNNFAGGVILPGHYLGRKALSTHTSGISEIEENSGRVLGLTTNECVNSGVHLSIIGGIGETIREMEKMAGSRLVVLATGGGVRKIIPDLELPTQHEPDLVLKGLVEVTR